MVNYNIFISGVTAVNKEFTKMVCRRKVGDDNFLLVVTRGP